MCSRIVGRSPHEQAELGARDGAGDAATRQVKAEEAAPVFTWGRIDIDRSIDAAVLNNGRLELIYIIVPTDAVRACCPCADDDGARHVKRHGRVNGG